MYLLLFSKKFVAQLSSTRIFRVPRLKLQEDFYCKTEGDFGTSMSKEKGLQSFTEDTNSIFFISTLSILNHHSLHLPYML